MSETVPWCREHFDPSQAPFPVFLCGESALARYNGKGILVYMQDQPSVGARIDEVVARYPAPRPLNKPARISVGLHDPVRERLVAGMTSDRPMCDCEQCAAEDGRPL